MANKYKDFRTADTNHRTPYRTFSQEKLIKNELDLSFAKVHIVNTLTVCVNLANTKPDFCCLGAQSRQRKKSAPVCVRLVWPAEHTRLDTETKDLGDSEQRERPAPAHTLLTHIWLEI